MSVAQPVRAGSTALAIPPRPRDAGRAATETILSGFIATTCLAPGDDTLRPDEPLLANGILDSLGIMHLAAFIEDTFAVTVPDDALLPEHFGTVRRVAALVKRLQAQAHAPH
jgi:acyl carrier protein